MNLEQRKANMIYEIASLIKDDPDTAPVLIEELVEIMFDEQIEINFNTAWGPPIEVCEKLRDMFPEVGFSWFYDEPGMETAGYL